jgi:predicted enzyme related to lactoylglutathione lyase
MDQSNRAQGPPIGSLLLGSSRADLVKQWYRRAFDVKENDMGAFEFGDVQLFIEPHSEIDGPTKEPARCIINLDVTDCRAYARQLRDLGARFVRELEQMPFGLIATVADPDGNYVQIIEWGATPEAHRGA